MSAKEVIIALIAAALSVSVVKLALSSSGSVSINRVRITFK